MDAWGTGEHDKISKIFLATRRDRARLICRVVRGVGVGAGLGFPVGDLRFAPVFTPNLRSTIRERFLISRSVGLETGFGIALFWSGASG